MKKLWPIILASLLAFSCGDDESSAPDDDEYSEGYDGGSSSSHGDYHHWDGSKKDDGKKEKPNKDDPFGVIDSSKIHTDDLIDIPKIDSMVQDTFVVDSKKQEDVDSMSCL